MAVQSGYLINMFDNYLIKHPNSLKGITCLHDIVQFVLNMLEFYSIELYFDPDKEDPSRNEDDDDLYIYCKVNKIFTSWILEDDIVTFRNLGYGK